MTGISLLEQVSEQEEEEDDKEYVKVLWSPLIYINSMKHQIQVMERPSCGSKGIVLLAFEDNRSSKIGVRFDKSVPNGNDLRGLCEDGHGFFCPASQLLNVDDSREDDFDNITIKEIFESHSHEAQEETVNPQLEEIEKFQPEEISAPLLVETAKPNRMKLLHLKEYT
ncbi:hypothetical protein RIF29_10042 [Crotalaria pallida]|uniref:Uncharacterized protein n=1 Tax=Crotalaria pallida TaxID=3830 RepID=A0AAN9FZW1_CROPI